MSSRTIRPRPLSYTERIPVIFLSRPKDGEEADAQPVDPALEQFLRNCEEEREREQHGLLSGLEYSRARKKSRKQNVSVPPSSAIAAGGKQSTAGPNSAEAPAAIAVPGCREIADYSANEEAMAKADARKEAEAALRLPLVPGLLPNASPALTALSGLSGLGADAAAYIIYQDVMRDRRTEPALMQYDMDEQDEKVLAGVNSALQRAAENAINRQSNGSSARTPPATRSACAAAEAARAAQLDADSYEGLVGVLERAHFEALQQRKELWQAEVKAGKVPKLPAADKILPWEAAVAAAEAHKPLPRALYNHWLKRRKQEGGPLLGYLWYEQPWKAICFQVRGPGQEAQQGDMPFMVAETKNSTRAGWSRLRIDKKEAHERLTEVREELELLRTMADQVRKRERLKKQLLKLYRAEICEKLGLPLHPHAKHPHATAAGAGGPAAAAAGAAAARPTKSAPAAAAAGAAATAGNAHPHKQPPTKRRRLASEAGDGRADPPQAAAPATTRTQAKPQQQPARGRPAKALKQQVGGESARGGVSARPSSSPAGLPSGAADVYHMDSDPDSEPPPRRGRSAPLLRRVKSRQQARRSTARAGAVGAIGGGGEASSSSLPLSSEEDSLSSGESFGHGGDAETSSEPSGSARSSEPDGSSAEEDVSSGGEAVALEYSSEDPKSDPEDGPGDAATGRRGARSRTPGTAIARGRRSTDGRASVPRRSVSGAGGPSGTQAPARRRSVSQLAARRSAAGTAAAERAQVARMARSSGAAASGSVARAAVQRAVARKRSAAAAATITAAAAPPPKVTAARAGSRRASAVGGLSADAGTEKVQAARGRPPKRAAASAPGPTNSPSSSSPTRSEPDRPLSSSSPERSRSPPRAASRGRGRGRGGSRLARPRSRSLRSTQDARQGQPQQSEQQGRPQRVRFASRSAELAMADGEDGRPRRRRKLTAQPPPPIADGIGATATGAVAGEKPLSRQHARQAAMAATPSSHAGASLRLCSEAGRGRGRGRSLLAGRGGRGQGGRGRGGRGRGGRRLSAPAVLESGNGETPASGIARRGSRRSLGASSRGRGGRGSLKQQATAQGLSGRKRPAEDATGAGEGPVAQSGGTQPTGKQPAADAATEPSALRKVRQGGVAKVFTRKSPLLRERNGGVGARLSAVGALETGKGRVKG